MLTSDGNLGPYVGCFGLATPSTGTHGNISVNIAVPYCCLGSHAVAQVMVTSEALCGGNSTTVGVDLLARLPFLDGITSYSTDVVARDDRGSLVPVGHPARHPASSGVACATPGPAATLRVANPYPLRDHSSALKPASDTPSHAVSACPVVARALRAAGAAPTPPANGRARGGVRRLLAISA